MLYRLSHLMIALQKDVVFLIESYDISHLPSQAGDFLLNGICQGHGREHSEVACRESDDRASSADLDSAKAQERCAAGDDIRRDLADDHHLLRIAGNQFRC